MPSLKSLDFGGIGGAVDSIFGGLGAMQTAKGYQAAAGYSRMSGQIAQQSTAIQQVQADREIYQSIGGTRADVAGANLAASGSALDIIRSSAQQGALTKQLIAAQGAINVLGYEQEAASYESMAKSSKKSGIGGFLKAGLQLASVAVAFSDDRLKEDVELQYRRDDGIGVYHFRYKGQPTVFEGVMAQEVLGVYPEAVQLDDDGRTLMVDYAKIGVEPKVVI